MEEQAASNPRLCTNNCGFYGSSQFEGMCSKCYRDQVNRSLNAGRTESFPTFYSSASSRSTAPADEPSPSPEQIDVSLPTVESSTVPETPTVTAEEAAVATMSEISSPSSNDSNVQEATSSSSVEKKKRNRCCWENCNKKLGLTGFQCRCGGEFCSLHRYANEHRCTFDYKEMGQNEIRKNMPVVQAERVRRI